MKKLALIALIILMLSICLFSAVGCSNKNITVVYDFGYENKTKVVTLLPGETLIEIIPNREGYIFLGWYIGDSQFTEFNTPPKSNLTLTAKWKEDLNIKITIVNKEDVQNYTVPDEITLEKFIADNKLNFEEENYTVDGFYTLADGIPTKFPISNVISKEIQLIVNKYLSGITFSDIDSTTCAIDSINDNVRNRTGIIFLPPFVGEKKVVKINNDVFSNSKASEYNLTKFITTIGDGAFANNYNVQKWNIPNSITEIGKGAFVVDYSLTNKPVLTNVYFEKNSKLKILSESLFNNQIKLQTIENIPQELITIGKYSFLNCFELKEFTIPNSVETIEEMAFQNCDMLKVVFPLDEFANDVLVTNKLKKIGKEAFSGSFKKLKNPSVIIPSSVMSIGNNAFYDCNPNMIIYEYLLPENDASFYPENAKGTRLHGTNWNSYSGPLGTDITLRTVKNPFKIEIAKLDSNGGNPIVAPDGYTTLIYGTEYIGDIKPYFPSKDKHNFLGYYNNLDDINPLINEKGVIVLKEKTNAGYFAAIKALRKSITEPNKLHVHWKEKT